MRSPTVALHWQTWGRHRWGLLGVAAGLLGLAALHRLVPRAWWLENDSAPVLTSIPIAFAFVYVFYAFSYTDLGARARAAGVPPWMFTLPVRTWALVAWPMLSGAVVVAAAWALVARFILGPAGLDLPLWPALGLAVTLAWVQAGDWSPFPALVKLLVIAPVVGGLWYGLFNDDYHRLTLALLPALLGLAFLSAVAGVGVARRGGLKVGAGRLGRPVRSAGFSPCGAADGLKPALRTGSVLVRRTPHRSPERAQFWLEWRRNGTFLPIVVAGWLALLMTLLALGGAGAARSVTGFCVSQVYVLPIFCVLTGCLLGRPDVWSRSPRLPAFTATRPLTSGGLVVAKLKMTTLSLFATGLLTAAVVLAWDALSGGTGSLLEAWGYFFPKRTGPEAWALAPLALASLFGLMWLQLAGHLFVSLTGRVWVLVAATVFYFGLLPNALVAVGVAEMGSPRIGQALAQALPRLAWAAVLAKAVAAGWAFRAAYRRRLLGGRAVVALLGAWLLTAGSLAALGALAFFDEYGASAAEAGNVLAVRLALLVLLCPLTRLGLAPLALAWNRHR
jgi:hypothetical protein